MTDAQAPELPTGPARAAVETPEALAAPPSATSTAASNPGAGVHAIGARTYLALTYSRPDTASS
ncbi:hypothetical protein [Promicromonospora sp. NPDC019610]|uniref:hypothetical protein n=1 Tax=Promicromonospora sp. NPDC019610 TaxID=3364405 RepID=UPI0037B8BAEC